MHLVKGEGKKGKGKDGKRIKGKGMGTAKTETGKGRGDERRCFYCDGKGHIKFNCPQKVIDEQEKSDPKSSSSTDNVMPVTMVERAE